MNGPVVSGSDRAVGHLGFGISNFGCFPRFLSLYYSRVHASFGDGVGCCGFFHSGVSRFLRGFLQIQVASLLILLINLKSMII